MTANAISVHAYVFMGNHIHLLLTTPAADALPRAMRKLGQCYVQAFNHRHHRCGPLWQGRFKSCLVDSDGYLLTVYRYIELNPVRAAMVARPEQHRWSSVHANLGLREDPLVTPHPSFLALHADRTARVNLYAQWLQQAIRRADLDGIRTHLQQQRALGSERFQVMVEQALGRPARVKPRGRPKRVPDDAGLA